MNFVSVTIQLIWPTAPPWYLELYGTKPPSYTMGGDPAGLANADIILGFKLFGRVYGNSPVVFGSFPSLHGAWPIMITLFTPSGKVYKIIGVIYASLVWWAAMYLNHHYLTDLLGGLFIVLLCYLGGVMSIQYMVSHFKDRIYGKAAAKGILRYNAEQADLELIVVQDEVLRSPIKLKKIPSRDDTVSMPLLDEASFTNVKLPLDTFKLNEKHL